MKSSRAPIITLVSLLVAAFISFSPSAAATGLNKGQQAKVKSLLTALASADPNKIKSAKIKFTAPDSKAFQFVDFVQNYYSTVQNLEIARVDVERQLILVKGAVPGAKNGQVVVSPAIKAKAKKGA